MSLTDATFLEVESMVTHQMFEILVGIARMPKAYRRVCAEDLAKEFGPLLAQCDDAEEAFKVLISKASVEQATPAGRDCYEAVLAAAGDALVAS